MEDLYINPKITIPSEYLTFSYSRSSGPGGQHVNKLNTRVSVFLDIRNCPCFSEQQKHKLTAALKGRVDKHGVLQVSSQRSRSQAGNRNAALQRMTELIGQTLKPKRTRKEMHVPKRAIEKRLNDKKSRSNIKRFRSEKPQEE
jgi:ribosome-associated protein